MCWLLAVGLSRAHSFRQCIIIIIIFHCSDYVWSARSTVLYVVMKGVSTHMHANERNVCRVCSLLCTQKFYPFEFKFVRSVVRQKEMHIYGVCVGTV